MGFESGEGPSAASEPPVPTGPWSAGRKELLAGLAKRAPHLSAIYEASVTIFSAVDYPARHLLVSHLVRELGNRLPDAFGVKVEDLRVEHVNRMDDIVTLWKAEHLPDDFATPLISPRAPDNPEEGLWLPRRTGEAFASLVRDHARSRSARKGAAIELFKELSRESGMTVDQLRPSAIQWEDIVKFFVRFVHAGTKARDVPEDDFARNFRLFEDHLGVMLRPFFSTLKEVDDFLDQANA